MPDKDYTFVTLQQHPLLVQVYTNNIQYLASVSIQLITISGDLMTIKYTQHTLDKVEKIIEDSGYVIRYERGTFQSGYCILQEKKVVVLNKFFQTEGRINTLIDLLPQLIINYDALTLESQKYYDGLLSQPTAK